MTVRIIQGDCRDVLATLPAESVHCSITSPPYWSLRDYGVAGQIGLEPTIAEYIAEMVSVFRAVHRVLRPDGTLWLNLGDSYAGGKVGNTNGGASSGLKNDGRPETSRQRTNIALAEDMAGMSFRKPLPDGLKPKDLCGIPWRVAFALQADGWYLRQDIIWAKPNPMPESVGDRCTKSHEYLFLLSKGPRYYFDAEAIREEAEYGRRDTAGEWRGGAYVNQRGAQSNSAGNGGRNSVTGKHPETGRNKRSVWTVATAPFSEAHFATFPPDLIEPCIKAGTSEKGCCGKCGAPWVRQTSVSYTNAGNGNNNMARKGASFEGTMSARPYEVRKLKSIETLGWQPTCKCDAPTVPCTVLDPFGGAGTTGLVADRLQRNTILIELNPQYAVMADRRIFNDAPLFASPREAAE